METKRLQPDLKVSFWGVKCFIHEESSTMWGVTPFYNALIPAAAAFHNFMSAIAYFFNPNWQQPGFRFVVLEDYREEDK